MLKENTHKNTQITHNSPTRRTTRQSLCVTPPTTERTSWWTLTLVTAQLRSWLPDSSHQVVGTATQHIQVHSPVRAPNSASCRLDWLRSDTLTAYFSTFSTRLTFRSTPPRHYCRVTTTPFHYSCRSQHTQLPPHHCGYYLLNEGLSCTRRSTIFQRPLVPEVITPAPDLQQAVTDLGLET